MEKKTLFQTIKFTLFSISAGVIQIGTCTLLNEVAGLVYWASYLISLILSVVWNFTFNRRYTFKSAKNIPIAMLMVAGYYAVFTPASVLWSWALEPFTKDTFYEYVVLGVTMIINFVTEFLFCKFVVYRNNENTNDLAKREKEKAEVQSDNDATESNNSDTNVIETDNKE